MRILLVEDDVVLGDGLCQGLGQDGHAVDWLERGDQCSDALAGDHFDAVILDMTLPGRCGFDVLSGWRSSGETVPVLILTAFGDTNGCIDSLDCGGDDYITKPVDLGELEARLRALVRRRSGNADNLLRCGTITVEVAGCAAWLGDEPVRLSSYEHSLLEALAERAGRAVSAEHLASRLYGWDDAPESNSLQVLIHYLRRKLGPRHIETVRGFGYRLVP